MNVYFMGMDEQQSDDGDYTLNALELHARCATAEEAIDLWREFYSEEIASDERFEETRDNPLPDGLWRQHPTTVGILRWHKDDGMMMIVDTRYHAIHQAKEALQL